MLISNYGHVAISDHNEVNLDKIGDLHRKEYKFHWGFDPIPMIEALDRRCCEIGFYSPKYSHGAQYPIVEQFHLLSALVLR